jgi:hypothetical protein
LYIANIFEIISTFSLSMIELSRIVLSKVRKLARILFTRCRGARVHGKYEVSTKSFRKFSS